MKLDKNGFSIIEILISGSILIIVILLSLFVWQHQKAKPNSINFNTHSAVEPAATGRYFIMSAQVLNWMVADQKARLSLKGDTIYVTNNHKIKLSKLELNF